MISEHISEWLGYKVQDYSGETMENPLEPNIIYRLKLDWDSEAPFSELFARFVEDPKSAQVPAIIIGQYHGEDPQKSSAEAIQLLVSARDKLPALKGIFVGEMISEENEISWIVQDDVSPLFDAYPRMEHFRVRGGTGLRFGRLQHANLKSLTVETGGLDGEVVRQILSSDFPELEHLELWLGTESYGGTVTMEDLQPLLSGRLFGKMKYLGLRDSDIADDVARALAQSPLLDRIEELDLSLGTLGDAGAEALLKSGKLKRLKSMDLHYHFLSKEMMKQLQEAVPTVDVSERQDEEDEDSRYVSVGE